MLSFMIAMLIVIPHTNAQQRTVVGGWSIFKSDITPEAATVFKTATQGLVGVSYEPIAVATQIVSGTNYSFFCNAKTVYPGSPNEAALIKIFQPLEGTPRITEIIKIEH